MRLEDLNDALGRIRDWIDNVDTKTSVLVAALAILLGFTLPEINDTKAILHRSGYTAFNMVLLGIWVIYLASLFHAMYHALHELTPHREWLQLNAIEGRPIITDFIGIGRMSFADYDSAVRSAEEEHLRRELIRLCYHYGSNLNHKFEHYIAAMLEFRIALLAQIAIFVWITIVLPSGV